MLQYRSLKLTNSKSNLKQNTQNLQNALLQMEMGVDIIITLQVEDSKIKKLKKVYFSMISELGKFAGYQSREDKESFKEQVRDQLGIESVAKITDCDEMRIFIESLHELAQKHYGYTFKPNDPDIITFGAQST